MRTLTQPQSPTVSAKLAAWAGSFSTELSRLNSRRTRYVIAVAIILLAGGLRLYKIGYGASQVCLIPPQEYWLYENPQVSSIYTWDMQLPGALNQTLAIDPAPELSSRAVASTPDELVLTRALGALLSLLSVALIMHVALRLKANWWALAGLCVACSPPFVEADRWVIRFDYAILAVALSVTLLCYARTALNQNTYHQVTAGLQATAAFSLLLIAPPLWWLAIALFLLQPRPQWRIGVFVVLSEIVAFPALRMPLAWISAAQVWDAGTTAACIWAGLALCLWHWRRLPTLLHAALLGLVLIGLGGYSLAGAALLPNPTSREWSLIEWLQTRLPDNAQVRFDAATWPLAGIITCPMGADVRILPQGQRVNMTFLAGSRVDQTAPDFVVTTSKQSIAGAPFIYTPVDGYYVARMMPLPHPVDIGFGDLFYVLSYQVATPKVTVGDWVKLRLDYQFAAGITIDALRYVAFIHVVPRDDQANNVINLSVPFAEESGFFGPRRMALNQVYRFAISDSVPPGTYDVEFGIFNVYTGERLKSAQGDSLLVGTIDVTAR